VTSTAALGQDTTRAPSADTTRHLVTRRDVLMLGGAALMTAAAAPFDAPIQHAMLAEDVHDSRALRGAANGLAFVGGAGPFIAGAGLYVVGSTAGSARLATLGVSLTEGVALAAALNGLVKGVSGRALPNVKTTDPGDFSFGRGFHEGNGPFVSFPSGHTAASFAAAAIIAGTAQDWSPATARVIRPIAYTTATLVAISRLYQNVHWASDLPLGAAIGIWSGRTILAWQHPHSGNRIAKELLNVTIAPARRGMVIGAQRTW
jgi:membrane-associated phospholipid phosphatase